MNKSTILPADEIWSLIKETQMNLKQFSADAEKRQAKIDRQIAETGRQLKRTGIKLDKFIGDTGNRWGKLGENLVKGSLAKRLKERGIKVEAVVTNARKHGVEFDIIALNGKEVVVVEVKATLDPPDVDKFKNNIEKFKILWPDFKKKTVYGAMAFLLKSKRKAESLAEKQGFFVISATGDVIVKNEKSFRPKVFSYTDLV